jgi:hypothetical protein
MAVEDRSRRRQNSQKIAGGRKDYKELLKMSGNSNDETWGIKRGRPDSYEFSTEIIYRG